MRVCVCLDHCKKALVPNDWIKAEILSNERPDWLGVPLRLLSVRWKLLNSILCIVLWLAAAVTTSSFSSKLRWKREMWFLMLMVLPKYFCVVEHTLHMVWQLSRFLLQSISWKSKCLHTLAVKLWDAGWIPISVFICLCSAMLVHM